MMYQFSYPEYNVIHDKLLIKHEDYETYRNMPQDSNNKTKKAKEFLKQITKGEEFFTDKSPLFEAISTGILNCNGIHKCIVTKL